MSKLIRMHVKNVFIDADSNMPIIILKDENETISVPIWVGVYEAGAIALGIEGIEAIRPQSHDVMKSLIQTFNGKVTSVVVSGLKENTFYAEIYVEKRKKTFCIDSRPSDAIALALRTNAPIFVSKDVIDQMSEYKSHYPLDSIDSLEEQIKGYWEDFDPEYFGKYKM